MKTYKLISLILILLLKLNSAKCQKWPLPINFSDYNRIIILSDSVNINDTIIYNHTENTYFRFVFFDTRGKCYCEVYKNNKLYDKGYYESSLDTLKQYFSSPKGHGLRGKLTVSQYFEPVKNGLWTEHYKGIRRKTYYVKGQGYSSQSRAED
ncbi:hypothetical protein [Ferruginibacter profundus]